MNLPFLGWFSLWTLDLPLSTTTRLPPSTPSGWMITRCLRNDLIHFYEVVYQSVLFLLMSTSVSRFSIHDAEQKNGMKHVNVETPNIRRSGVTGRLRFHKAASSKKRPQLSSELGAGMCFVNESQCWAVTLGWYPSVCVFWVCFLCVCVSHSFHNRLQRWFTLATTIQSGLVPRFCRFIVSAGLEWMRRRAIRRAR